MSTDKRSVSTDALETLGSIINEGAGRDAIHLAVEPSVAAETLYPGQHVGFVEDGVGASKSPVGIVDPFLQGAVFKGQRFWMVVYPRQITSLRHVWTHPAFDEPQTDADKSKVWLEKYAATIPVHYSELIERANDYLQDGNYWSEGGRFEGEYIPDEFWDHFQNVTGKKVEKRGNFFSYSC